MITSDQSTLVVDPNVPDAPAENVATVARWLLGLTPKQAEDLFDASNDRATLRECCEALVADPGVDLAPIIELCYLRQNGMLDEDEP